MTSDSGDDYIGTESCIDLQNDIVVDHSCEISKTNNSAVLKSNIKRKEKRVFPPPIPHMPWVLTRHYTTDGRLIITKQKVNHHEYFRAHRANGRLTLHLVPLHHEPTKEEEEEAPTIPRENYGTHENVKTIGLTMTRVPNKNSIELPLRIDKGGTSSKHFNCYRVRSSPSCIFRVPVHPVNRSLISLR